MKKQLYAISTGKQPSEQLAAIASHIHPYVDAIHIREKTKTAKELFELVERFLDSGVPAEKIIINDRADVAAACGVKGVQLAYHSLSAKAVKKAFPSLVVGCSVHSLQEAIEAEQNGADYCIYGHVFPTECKAKMPPRGIEKLAQITAAVSIPVIAIGGIRLDNVSQVWEAGAHGIAVMSGIFLAENPLVQAKRYAMMTSMQNRERDEHEWPSL
ncbi:thiazole tautomerase TenI [Anoxybacillus tepidamans]|uniref:thiazole tautomerase TenI n=1 Tax=Anoxybacteroides tepidamans TaxID=265948 RepID=UPI00068752C7|nr:thiazole tautomerase TenI [Anoxybacillus tepidamans]